jgi:hypothetical protein
MPAFQTLLSEINDGFGKEQIADLIARREAFAPGCALDVKQFFKEQSKLVKALDKYVKQMPASFREMLRAIIYHALSAKPATRITFAWAPGYDYELTMWDAPDTKATKGGITVLIRSRYPSDAHPLSRGG